MKFYLRSSDGEKVDAPSAKPLGHMGAYLEAKMRSVYVPFDGIIAKKHKKGKRL